MHSSKVHKRPGIVTHVCNPTYSGGRDLEDHGYLEASPGKKLARPHVNHETGSGGIHLSSQLFRRQTLGGLRFQIGSGQNCDTPSEEDKTKKENNKKTQK
jgi:hypothetical protein